MELTLPARVGGRLALDFVNTAEGRGTPEFREFLDDYATFAAWAGGADAPGDSADEADDSPDQVHAGLIALREALYAVFVASLTHQQAREHDLAVVNAALTQATRHHVLLSAETGGVRDGWVGSPALDAPLWPIMIDAWDILTTDAMRRVRQCPGHACGWLFLDASRSGTRRWCDMRTCGNRAKAATHYARAKDGAPQ